MPLEVSRGRVWLLAVRPQTLPAAVAPVLVGLGASTGLAIPFRADTAIGCLAVALLLQIVANLANDVADFHRGADTAARLGPTRVAATGLLTTRQLMAGVGVACLLAGVVGLYLVAVGGPALLLVGGLAIVAALAYTGGPLPYGYVGLGEPFAFLFFGPVAVIGTGYLQALRVEPRFVAASLPIGALVTAILVVNNLRDSATDRQAGKRTLAVLLGERFARAEYMGLILGAAAVPVLMVAAGHGGPGVLIGLLALPLAVPLVREVLAVGQDSDRRRLNGVLKGTARLSLAFGVLFAVGLATSGRA
jgi:1,4-dihydroxy-2-naphthoate polyprenyltransferase